MTLLAGHIRMAARQREWTLVVIEIDIIPTAWVMAQGTVGTVLSVMFIILFVAGKTVCGGIFIDAVLVACFTGSFGVLAFQFETREVVVELCGSPGIGGMTGGAIGAKTSLMRLIGTMT